MATNYSPTIVTDGAVFVGDARMPSISEPGTRLYNRAGIDSADVKLLIHGNVGSGQSFADSSLSNHTVTANGDVTHSSTQSKFSGESIYFDGTGDYLSIPDSSDWAFGTDDFTIDFWFNPTGFSSYTGLIVQNPTTFGSADSDHGLFIEVDNASTKLRLFIRPLTDPYSADMFTEISQTGIVAGTWYHVAVVRETGLDKITMYLNGTSVGSSTWSGSTSYPDFATPLLIGVRNDQSDYFHGYMDEVRITKGTALWTQNFTPPARRDTLSISDGMMYNGTSLNFDNTDDYITINGFASNDPGTDSAWAVTFWARGDTATGSANHDMVFSGHTASGGNIIRIGYDRTNGGIFYSDDNTTDKYAGTTFYNDNTWHHVVITRPSGSGAQTTDVYVDGAKITGGTFSTSDPTWASATQFSIGQEWDTATPGDYFDGDLADIRVYNAKLSATQVTELYNDSKVVVPSNVSLTNLLGWWPLCEGAGSVAYDGSGKGSHGTLVNNPGWSTGQTGCPQLVQGYNRPMLFDGSSDYVSIADSATLSVGSTFTISYWFYPEDITTESYHIAKNTYTGNQKSYAVNQYSTGKTQFRISGDGSSHIECTGDTVMSNKAWHHIVHVFDGGAGTKLKGWVDGTAQSFNQQPNVTAAYDSTSILCLGTRDAGLVAPFAGIINEVIIYNSALDATDAAALYATGPNGGPLPPDPRTMSYSSSTTSANIMGYWRNDNNVTLTDLSGNSNTGTAIGSPDALLFKQGYSGSASTSTGRDNQGFPLKYKDVGAIGFVNDSVDFGNVISFDNTDNFTVEAWFRADVASGMDSYQPIISKEGSSEFGYGLKIDRAVAGGPWFYGIATGTTNRYQYAAALTNGEWYHGCVLFSSSANYITVFINGEQSHGPYSSQGAFSGTTSANSLKFGQTGSSFIGQIGSSKIYNRLLSQAEIKQNYNAQKSRFT